MAAVREIGTWAMGGMLAWLPVGTAGAVDLVDSVELIKGVDRDDGELLPPAEEPYFVELCLTGLVAQPPYGIATVKRPGGFFDEPIVLPGCLEYSFETQQDLDNAFPSTGGVYQFNFSKSGVGSDSIGVAYNVHAPRGFADVEEPADGAADVVPGELSVGWSVDTAGCVPSRTLGDCGDGFQVFVVDPQLEADIFEAPGLPIGTSEVTVPAGVLQPETDYDVELETFVGNIDLHTTTNGGDPVSVKAIFKDINNTSFTTTVPEPAGAALGLAALSATGLLGRRRRGGRAPS